VPPCLRGGSFWGLAFQFPDYQITQLPNPNHSITKSRAPQIPVIPIWRRLQQLPQQIALFFSVSPCLRGGCSVFQLHDYPITQLPNYPITKLPNYPITQLPQLQNLGGPPLRSQSSQFGVDFSNFHSKSRCFSPCPRVSVPPGGGFGLAFQFPDYQITQLPNPNLWGLPPRSQ
jgi:hypothetical protein